MRGWRVGPSHGCGSLWDGKTETEIEQITGILVLMFVGVCGEEIVDVDGFLVELHAGVDLVLEIGGERGGLVEVDLVNARDARDGC